MPTALPLLVIAYVLGLWLGDDVHMGLATARVCGLVCGAGMVVAFRWRRGQGLSLLLGALSLGLLAQAHREGASPWLDPVHRLVSAPASGVPDPVHCLGGVAAPPALSAEGFTVRVALSRCGPPDPGGAWREIAPPALVAVSVRGPLKEPLSAGDRVLLRARLRPPGGFRNPDASDGVRRAAVDGIDALASVEPAALVRWEEPDRKGSTLLALRRALLVQVTRVRERLDGVLRQRLLPPGKRDPSRYALVTSLVLGIRGALFQADAIRQELLLPSIDRAFRDAGIYHVLSVSGFHLAVATFLFYSGLGGLLRHIPQLARRVAAARLAALLAIPATIFYTLLTGAEVATVRAAGVAVLWLLAVVCNRRARLAEALAGAVLFILHPLGSPLSLFDPALQLSLAAALGTAYLRPFRETQALWRKMRHRQRPDDPEKGPKDAVQRAAAWAVRLLEASTAAILATTPLCALYFAQFQAAGLLGNLFAAPLGELIVVPVGLGGALISLVWPALGGALLSVAGTCAVAMAELAVQVADIGLSYSVPVPGSLVLLLWAAGLCCLGLRLWPWPLLCAAALGLYLISWGLPPGHFRVTFLDVGQGDAAVLELPRGGVVVIDGGGLGTEAYDPGERIVVPFLRRRGHRRIDLLIASHPHPDHVTGLAALIEQFPVGELWTAERGDKGLVSREPIDPSFLRVLQAAARHRVPLGIPRPLVLGGVDIEPLAPCAATGPCQVLPLAGRGHNDNSLVLRVRYAGRVLLFPGDLELPGELALLDRHDQGVDVRADLLKAPHHCSRTSSSESFVSEVAPSAVVCSVGRQNRYGFPHEEVVKRYEQRGIRVLRTDRDGAIQAIIQPSGEWRLLTTRAAGD